MSELRYQTAGESHGPALTTLVNGIPAGLTVDRELIDTELARRQGGYGRGARQRIETDRAEYLAGVRRGVTTGAPIVIQVINRDSRLDDLERTPPVHRPRPGHADLSGAAKWLTDDCRDTLERASARETAARTAAGALARLLLREVGIETFGFVRSVLDAETALVLGPASIDSAALDALRQDRDASEAYCPDETATTEMVARIRQAKVDKDTVGGVVECHVFGCPMGLGTCVNGDERLDARLAGAVMGIQAFKGVEIGLGFGCTRRPGSQVHDPIVLDPAQRDSPHFGFTRPSNNAGGLEGGMTNGMPVVVRGAMKPISTLLRGLPSVDLRTGEAQQSAYERSDICAVAAASVVMEHVVAFEIARAFLDKFGSDTMAEVHAAYRAWSDMARARLADGADRR